MPELKEVFDMVTNQTEPDLDSWNKQEERQRRTARDRKVGALVLVAAIAVAAAVVLIRADDGARTTTVGTDTTSSPQRVATSFAESYGAFDAAGAIDHLADDADVSGLMLGPADVDTEAAFRLNMRMLDATGFTQLLGPCEVTQTGGTVSVVQCPFDFFIAGSDYGGQGAAPFGGGSYEVKVDGDEITQASVDWGRNFSGTWKEFALWVSREHPNDAASMFTDDSPTAIRLSEDSVRLWRLNLYRYVETPPFCVVAPQCAF